jgi:hypothetical protein
MSLEFVKLTIQQMQHPDIAGVEYQQGPLFQRSLREYLLEQWHGTCAYCGRSEGRMEIDHLVPRSKGGTNSLGNFVLACATCNGKKTNQAVDEFLKDRPTLLMHITAHAACVKRDAGVMNCMRWVLRRRLEGLGVPLEVANAMTTYTNRLERGLEKTHWLDAACVGHSTPHDVKIDGVNPLSMKATGHGTRQMCGTDRYGFPIRHRTRQHVFWGFQTGDMVKAVVTHGTKIGTYEGRVLVRASGRFDIVTATGRVQGISWQQCRLLHHADGYHYRTTG